MIVRVTADCPLLDPIVIAACVHAFEPASVDYVTTDHDHSVAHGFDVEVSRGCARSTAGDGPDRST